MFCRGKQGKIFISLQKFTIAAKRAVKSFSTKLTSSLFTFHPAFSTVHTQPYNQNYQQRACVSIYIWILPYKKKGNIHQHHQLRFRCGTDRIGKYWITGKLFHKKKRNKKTNCCTQDLASGFHQIHQIPNKGTCVWCGIATDY